MLCFSFTTLLLYNYHAKHPTPAQRLGVRGLAISGISYIVLRVPKDLKDLIVLTSNSIAVYNVICFLYFCCRKGIYILRMWRTVLTD